MSSHGFSRRAATLLLAACAAVLLAAHPFSPPARAHEVRMIGDAKHAAFEPAELRVDRGDTVVFLVASGQPHNVAFDTTSLSAAQKHALRPLIHDEMLPFAGPLLVNAGDRYTLDTAGLPAGTYPFYCMTHIALNMRGTLVVK